MGLATTATDTFPIVTSTATTTQHNTTPLAMPLPTHILLAVAWYWCISMLHYVRYGHSKPRLAAHRRHLARHLSVDRSCQTLTRLHTRELKKLCRDLLIDPRAGITGNWRFSPLHRAAVALGSLASPITSRRARQAFGWAANSVGANMENFVQCVIDHLDADDSRQLLITYAV